MNGAPFQSPQMAHSPPNTQPGGAPPHNPMAPVGQNQPLTQMNRGQMHPPNGPPGAQQTPQQQAFQNLHGRSSSNPGSPAVQASPSMAHRQVSGVTGMMPISPEMLLNELNRIPPPTLHKLKQDLGIGDKDINALTMEEKVRMLLTYG